MIQTAVNVPFISLMDSLCVHYSIYFIPYRTQACAYHAISPCDTESGYYYGNGQIPPILFCPTHFFMSVRPVTGDDLRAHYFIQ